MNQRTAQLDRTRQAIIEAAIDRYLGESDPDDLTMQALADAAGVSHRTLYRHFPSRRDLINEVGKEIDRRAESAGGWRELSDFDTWVASIDHVMAFGAANREELRRGNSLSLRTGDYRTDRDERYWRMFRDRFPHLDESTAREAFICVRMLLGASSVLFIGERFELSPEELSPVISFGVETLVARIEELDRKAAETG